MEPHADSRTSASLLGRLGGNPHDAQAWEEFAQRYGGKILQWCRQYKLQDADAQDVTQNVLLKIAQRLRTFRYDPAQSFRGWLKTLTRAAWCDWLGEQGRPDRASGTSDVLELLRTVEGRDNLEQKLEEEYDRELLNAATCRVRLRVESHTWEAFRLMTFEGLSGAQTAERLSMKVATVFVARSKVQKMLKETIEQLENDG